MNICPLCEAPRFECPLDPEFHLRSGMNLSIGSIIKDYAEMVDSFCCSRNYLTHSMLHLNKSQIRLKMECCCHLGAGAAQSLLSSFDWVQNDLCCLVENVSVEKAWEIIQCCKCVTILTLKWAQFHQFRDLILGVSHQLITLISFVRKKFYSVLPTPFYAMTFVPCYSVYHFT